MGYSTSLSLKERIMSCKKNCMNRYASIDFDRGTPNRFDLEVVIANNMNIIDNLNTVIEDILEGDGFMNDPDTLVNTLQGIVNLHTINQGKLFTTFVRLFRLDGHLDGLYTQDVEDEYEEDYHD